MCCASSIGSMGGGLSRLSCLCRARHGPSGFQESIRRPDGAFCCGRLKCLTAVAFATTFAFPEWSQDGAGAKFAVIGALNGLIYAMLTHKRGARVPPLSGGSRSRWRRVCCLTNRYRRTKACRHAFYVRKSHARSPLPVSLDVRQLSR